MEHAKNISITTEKIQEKLGFWNYVLSFVGNLFLAKRIASLESIMNSGRIKVGGNSGTTVIVM